MRFLYSIAGLVALTAIMPLWVEGQQNPWGQWSSCSKTCGGGLRSRKPRCRHPQNKCPLETEACNGQACNVNASSGVNVTSRPSEAWNGTVQPSATEALNANSGTPKLRDTLQPTVNQALNATSGTLQRIDTVKPTPNEGSNATSITLQPIDTVKPTPNEDSNATSEAQPSDTQGPKSTEATLDGDTTVGKAGVSTQMSKDVETEVYIGSATMDKKWSEELANPTSQQYRELKKTCQTSLEETFKNEEGITAIEVIKFTQGSVVMHFRVSVQTLSSRKVPRSKLERVLITSLQSGPMKDLKITSLKLSNMAHLTNEGSSTRVGGESDVFEDPWKYFLYGFGVMIALAIIFVLLGVIKMKLAPRPQDQLEEGSLGFERKFSFPGSKRQSELEDQNKREKKNDDDFKIFHY